MERRAFGELEGQVLAARWAADRPLVPAEALDAVGGDLAYTTVMTILVRLHDKGLIERLLDGLSADDEDLLRALLAKATGRRAGGNGR